MSDLAIGPADGRRQECLRHGEVGSTAAGDKPNQWLEQTCFYTELLALCYLYAPEDHPNRDAYLAKASELMANAEDRWPGTYTATKSLIMCFANTGACQKAVSEEE